MRCMAGGDGIDNLAGGAPIVVNYYLDKKTGTQIWIILNRLPFLSII